MNAFSEAYNSLNDAQKQAVDAIDGPLLVLAGPGSGKTQLLSTRVTNILKITDTDPSNILCLTFTNKAAINMQGRVANLTGGAFGVVVKTFHGFAAELMNTYPEHFWNGARLQIAPDAVQLETIQNILKQLPLDNPLALKFAGKFTSGKDVMNGLKLAKEAGLTPEKLEALIKANLAYIDSIELALIKALTPPLKYKSLNDILEAVKALPEQGISTNLEPLVSLKTVLLESLEFALEQDAPTSKTTHTGKWKSKLLQTVDGEKGMYQERKRNHWWLALAEVYTKYRDELHSRSYYDYADMIIESITQLEAQPDMRADVQERFRYVLIDEFQDTNAAQLRVAHLVADHYANAGNPNLMVVGDDDQSIYKFNGAELNNMLSFERSYPKCQKIVLTENYRSTQSILDTATKVITKASDRLVYRDPSLQKTLTASNPTIGKSNIRHEVYQTQDEELSAVAKYIAKRRKASKQSIAVLARGHSSLRSLAGLLLNIDVPVAYEEQNNILEHQAVVEIYTIAALLCAINGGDVEQSNALLSQTLRHPVWQQSPENLWKMAIANRRSGNWLNYCLNSKVDSQRTTAQWLLWLAKESTNQPLLTTIEHIIGLRAGQHLTSPIRGYYIDQQTISTDYLHALSAIRLLLHTTQEYSTQLEAASLQDFVSYIQLQNDNKQVIADESSFVSGHNPVELLSVHKAKGLEFDEVIIIDAIANNWQPRSGQRKSPINLPLQPPLDDMDDYIRLMFVAMTRAKQHLLVTSFCEDTSGGEVAPSPLLHEVMTTTKQPKLPDNQLIEILERQLSWPELSTTNAKLALSREIDNFSLSASALLNFLDVSRGGPEVFVQKHLLSLPAAKNPQMAFGSSIHSSLEYAQSLVNQDSFNLPGVLEHFSAVLQKQFLSVSEFDRYNQHGKDLLSQLFNNKYLQLTKGSRAELRFSDITYNSARLNGSIDRLDSSGDEILITDYKTGSPLSSLNTKDKTKLVTAWRHRYQLIFYAVLLEQSGQYKNKNISTQMMYIEAPDPKHIVRTYTPTEQDKQHMQQLISAVWQLVKNYNLPDVSKYSRDYDGIIKFEEDLLKQ